MISPLRTPSQFCAFLLLAAGFLFAACETTPSRPAINYTGDPVVDGQSELAVAVPKDKVLWNYRITAAAMRTDRFAEARNQLDTALPLIGGVLANSADAKKARSLFSGENSKTFIGEPYERIMAYYYRAILCWMDGEPDNARACYRSAQLIDSDAEQNAYKCDYVLLDYLEAQASSRLGSDGSDSLARARKNSTVPLPDPDPKDNVLIFAEFGHGPTKYAGGEYGEELRFIVRDSQAYSARLSIEGRVVPLPALDDLNFQATTRGGRVMDHILGNKAVFKGTTDAVGNVALVGAAVAAANMRREDGSTSRNAQNTAIALGAIGLISKIASAATVAHADIRSWDNLPQRLSFAAIRLAPGEHSAKLEFLDRNGFPLTALTRTTTINVRPEGNTIVFLSELKR
jgi:hypothetical protein